MSRKIEINVRTIYELAGIPIPEAPPTAAELGPLVSRQFTFLPQPIHLELDGWKATISYPQESTAAKAEAARLGEKAGKRASQGDYVKAISIWKRALELEPSNSVMRRDLAMAYVEAGNADGAKNHLIEVLRLSPDDVWGLVVLGNLYKAADKDMAVAERFIGRALMLKPDDPWGLNSLAAVRMEQGRIPEALELFSKAIAVKPDFANPYLGMGMALYNAGRFVEAKDTVEGLFARGQMQDARSQPVFDEARRMYSALMGDLAAKHHDEAFKATEVIKREMQALSGYPVRVEAGELPGSTAAVIQMAWKHGRNYHIVLHRNNYPEHLLTHLVAHELGHLRLECTARAHNCNRIPMTTPANREKAIRSMANDVTRWQRQGYDEQSITHVTLELASGIVRQITNTPVDMLIEWHIHTHYPGLRPCQFVSLQKLAKEAEDAVTGPKIREVTPKKILLASAALNGATALFLDELWRGATNYAAAYQRMDSFPVSRRLYEMVRSKSGSVQPGEEYEIVDAFAAVLGFEGWYSWKKDDGRHTVTDRGTPEGTTNPELLTQKHPAAVWHLLAALKRFDALPVEQVRAISFEIALLGRNGLDYASSDQKYELESCPGERFSGLQLMCMMYAGFAQVAPEHDTGIDLRAPFLTALELFENEKG